MTESSCARFSPGDWVVRKSKREAGLTREIDPSEGGQVVDRVIERRPGHPEHGQAVAVVVSWGSFTAVEPMSSLAPLPARCRALLVCPYCGHRRYGQGPKGSGQWCCPRCSSVSPLPESQWVAESVARSGQGTCDHCHSDALVIVIDQLSCRRCRARGPRPRTLPLQDVASGVRP